MSQDQPWSVKRLLEWTTDYLRGCGAVSARLEAELLLAHALGCKRIDLYTRFDSEPTDSQRQAFRELVRQRGKGEPVAYLIGHKEFFSLDFLVGKGVLIPRPETEQLVLELLDAIKSWKLKYPGKRCHFVDIGTGSGNIAVAAAKHVGDCTITAIDVSSEALDIARKNAVRHQVSDRIRFYESDLFDKLTPDSFPDLFDMVVSNPPYVTAAEYESLEPMVRDYEPRVALLGGTDGLEVIRRLIADSPRFCNSDSQLFIEAGPSTMPGVVELLQASGFWSHYKIIKDYGGRERFVVAQSSFYHS